MFLIVPIHRRLDWRRAPWVTLLLILINCIVYFGIQSGDDAHRAAAIDYYYQHGLAQIEQPRYLDWLRDNGQSDKAGKLARLRGTPREPLILINLQQDHDFRAALAAEQIVKPDEPDYRHWRHDRRRFSQLWGQSVTDRYMFDPERPSVLTWFTSMFMHGGVGHLLGNMVFLLIIGMLVEPALGSLRFTAGYLLGGAGASAAYLLAHWNGGLPSLGASGAIAGLMGLYTVLFGMRRVRFFYVVLFYFDFFKAPAIAVLPFWLGEQIIDALTSTEPVAYSAHIGGIVTGALLGVWHRWRGNERRDYLDEEIHQAEDAAKYQQALDLLGQVRFAEAVRLLRELAGQHPDQRQYLQQWYKAARHDPGGEAYHSAALRMVMLPGSDRATLTLVRDTWQDYRSVTQGRLRLNADQLAALARRFANNGMPDDARPIVQALARKQPNQSTTAGLFADLARSYLAAGERRQAGLFAGLILDKFPGSEAAREAAVIRDRLDLAPDESIPAS